VNVTRLVKQHEEKRHYEADDGPLETADDSFKHPDNTVTLVATTSKARPLFSQSRPAMSEARRNRALALRNSVITNQIIRFSIAQRLSR